MHNVKRDSDQDADAFRTLHHVNDLALLLAVLPKGLELVSSGKMGWGHDWIFSTAFLHGHRLRCHIPSGCLYNRLVYESRS